MTTNRDWKTFNKAWQEGDPALRLADLLRVASWPFSHPHRAAKAMEPWGILVAVIALVFEVGQRYEDRVDRNRDLADRSWSKVQAAYPDNGPQGGLGSAVQTLVLLKENTAGIKLRNAELFGIDLSDGYLYRADLSDTNLFGARLKGAHLIASNLSGATLVDADLSGATLAHADLRNANLVRSNLTNVDLTAADLSGADFCMSMGLGFSIEGARRKVMIKEKLTELGNPDHKLPVQTTARDRLYLELGPNVGPEDCWRFSNHRDFPELEGATMCETTMPDGTACNRDCAADALRNDAGLGCSWFDRSRKSSSLN